MIAIPTAKITTNSVICYNSYIHNNKPKTYNNKSKENLTRGKYNGFLSQTQRKRILSIVTNLHISSNANLLHSHSQFLSKIKPITFLTLTLAQLQKDDDKIVKRKLLDGFIINMRRKGYLQNYIWKSEAQKNGNIHFHLIFTDFIPKKLINSTWNSILTLHGYTDNYFTKYKSRQAPSTKIEASRSVNSTGSYLAKYIAKNENNRQINGRIWGCSDNLRVLTDCKIEISNDFEQFLENKANKNILHKIQNDHCTIYSGNIFKECISQFGYLKEIFISNAFVNKYRLINGEIPKEIEKIEHKIVPKLAKQLVINAFYN